MGALFLSFIAGALTTINPCVLPLLPVVFATALTTGRAGPLALVAGLVTGFTAVGVAVAAAGSFFGIDERTIRPIVAILFIAIGAALMYSPLERKFSSLFAPIGATGATLAARASAFGIAGQFAVGLLLGAIWSPCSGPALGAAIGLAAEAGGVPLAALRMAVFGLGAASILLLLAYGSRAFVAHKRERLIWVARIAKPTAGAVFLALGLAMLTGFDKQVETMLLDVTPDWLVNLTTSI
jgi:cytochrome c biogenesis protein CcdA